MGKRLSREYKMNKDFYNMSAETQTCLRIIMTILETSHLIENGDQYSPRKLIEIYTPENSILETQNYITWGQAVHVIITDVIQKKDLLSQAPSKELRH